MEHQPLPVSLRVTQLAQGGRTGPEIARIMREEEYSLPETWEALLNAGYAAQIIDKPDGTSVLCVSDYPPQAGLIALIVALANPENLPEVVWEQQVGLHVP